MTHKYKVGDKVVIQSDDYPEQPRGSVQVVNGLFLSGRGVYCGDCLYFNCEVELETAEHPAELAARLGIVITITVNSLTFTYDGRPNQA